MQDMLLKKSSWKWKLEWVLHKGQKVVQSRDQANMNLVLVQSRNSSQKLYHFRDRTSPAASCNIACSPIILEWGNKNSKYGSP